MINIRVEKSYLLNILPRKNPIWSNSEVNNEVKKWSIVGTPRQNQFLTATMICENYLRLYFNNLLIVMMAETD